MSKPWIKLVSEWICALVMGVLLAACSPDLKTLSGPEIQASSAQVQPIQDYKIGVDDVIQVDVWQNPDLRVTVPVRPDGKISVPLVGDVLVGGLPAEQVSGIIQKKLAAFIRDPHVTVIITELRSHEFLTRIRITGAVQQPSSIPYRQGMTVLDAVLESGGINEFAAPDRTKVYRKSAGKTGVISVYLGSILNKGDLSSNYYLNPGDVITVPERLF